MKCKDCKTTNRKHRVYCKKCGAELYENCYEKKVA